MVIISYDISDDRKRAKFNRYIRKFGYRLQYSVYEIENSNRILDNIILDIENTYMPLFDESDSVYIFKMSDGCKIQKYGYASHEDDDFLIIE